MHVLVKCLTLFTSIALGDNLAVYRHTVEDVLLILRSYSLQVKDTLLMGPAIFVLCRKAVLSMEVENVLTPYTQVCKSLEIWKVHVHSV